MPVLPVDEIGAAEVADGATTWLGFPFASNRSSGAGELSSFVLGDALDLFVLALTALTRRFGEPDVPNVDQRRAADDGEVFVVWTEQEEDTIRIISARRATRRERDHYRKFVEQQR